MTNQWFANLYLDELDHWLKETRRIPIPVYVRYMDDIACWANSKDELFGLAADLRIFLGQRLQLALKEERTLVAPVSEGMPFLGWRVYPGLLRQQRRRLCRQRRLLERREVALFLRGQLSAGRLQDCIRAMNGPRQFLGYGEPIRSFLDV